MKALNNPGIGVLRLPEMSRVDTLSDYENPGKLEPLVCSIVLTAFHSPPCGKRKIKRDTQRSECGQAYHSGRYCQLLDTLSRQHSSPVSTSRSHITHEDRRKPSCCDEVNQGNLLEKRRPGVTLGERSQQSVVVSEEESQKISNGLSCFSADIEPIDDGNPAEPQPRPTESTALQGRAISSPPLALDTFGLLNASFIMDDPSHFPDLAGIAVTTEQNTLGRFYDGTIPGGTSREIVRRTLQSRIPNVCDRDTYQDRCEIAFFLRCFSEGPGKWMDVLGNHQLYFSHNIVFLSRTSAAVRYAACALGAKYLGRIKAPGLKTHNAMRNVFAEPQPDFLWYGTKYYEKSLQLLARQAPCDGPGITQALPCSANQTPMTTTSGNGANSSDGYDMAVNIYPAVAECILSQYEDISATVTTGAVSSHLNNVDKLLRLSANDCVSPWTSSYIPEPAKAIDSIFWCFAINDNLDACKC